MVELTPHQRKNSIEFKDWYYATIDFHPPSDSVSSGGVIPSPLLALPHGWTLAPDNPDIVSHVIEKHPWGAALAVVSSGRAFWTAAVGPPWGHYADCTFKVVGNQYKVSDGTSCRIIIRHPKAPAWEPAIHCASMGADLWQERQFTDCKVVSENETTLCHRAVLARASPVFKQMFASQMSEAIEQRVEISDASPKIVHAMVKFMYTGEIEPSKQSAIELLSIADKYQVETLALACYPIVLQSVNADNVVAVIRALKGFSQLPRFKDIWTHFQRHIREDDDLFEAAFKMI
eukprot:gnl/TRDRNA2_/TRDRNA2_71605_c0_seq1.p1 gnl/TRDRNA2_/TRDRNA2_71605_c0~~gnl/TRDRNA2_/TRDRNA2_71605_c0_seq1.p1  ORF type:complete len:289 (-),score=21.06 gnl/TRDRNA2_/TRDRNA2_71605_c0_seq1:219-1085(-)